jgi:chaperone BCS1
MDLEQLLSGNQFMSGGLVLMATGAVMAVLRNVPVELYNWLMRRLFLDITIKANDDSFEWVEIWLAKHKYSEERARDLKVLTTRQGRRTEAMPTIFFAPAEGRHWIWWRGHFLSVYRGKEDPGGDSHAGGRPSMSSGIQPKEYFCVSILTRNRALMSEMMQDAYLAAHPESENKIYIRQARWGDWTRNMERRPRSLESVVMRAGLMEGLLEDVKDFLSRAEWYHEMGIPHRRGYLLEGPPGNGKSSAVIAIASAMKLDICIISLGGVGMDDQSLASSFSEVPPESIVLLEDIDCVFRERKKGEDQGGGVTFSGLLNAIDGVVASEGRILFLTSNHADQLDPALIRPGRCDVRLTIDNADPDQAERLFARFFPGKPAMGKRFGAVAQGQSVATLQGVLLKNRTDPEAAIADAIGLTVRLNAA